MATAVRDDAPLPDVALKDELVKGKGPHVHEQAPLLRGRQDLRPVAEPVGQRGAGGEQVELRLPHQSVGS
jgi:hypothetical protein